MIHIAALVVIYLIVAGI